MEINNELIEKLILKLEQNNIDISIYEKELENINNKLNNSKFGLVWENYNEDIENKLGSHIPILIKDNDMSIIKDKNKVNNILIEGDNLTSLTALKNEEKKIDVILIDPPYNTGNEFIYNDKIINKKDTWKHSKWLSFMEKRLRLSYEILKDTGIIAINISKHEQSHLKLLMDEIYGENNFITQFIWINQPSGRVLDKHILNTHEYILLYAKNINKVTINKKQIKDKNILDKYNSEDDISKYKKGPVFHNSDSQFNIDTRNTLAYTIYIDKSTYEAKCINETVKDNHGNYYIKDVTYDKEKYYRIVPPIRKTNNKVGCWRWGITKFLKDYKSELIFDEKLLKFYIKDRLHKKGKTTKYKDIITDIVGTKGTNETTDMFGDKVFNHPKPKDLIKLLLNITSNKSSIILDFFAGSGTTGHAVLELNKEDGGNRQFILCTNNENNICRDITYQKLNKVINGFTTIKGKQVEGIDSNLIYYTTYLKEK